MQRERVHVLIPGRPYDRRAFTITELVIVVAIIVILISILIPALGKAREQGRRTKCMAHQRTLAQAVQAFAVEHQGYGQLLGHPQSHLDYGVFRGRYKYEVWPWEFKYASDRTSQTIPSPWPIAYANYLGVPGLKSEDFFTRVYPPPAANAPRVPGRGAKADTDPRWPADMRKIAVLRCPSDRDLAGRLGPEDLNYAAVSYRPNWDIFHHPNPRSKYPLLRHAWRNGVKDNGERLAGRLDGVIRPSEVVMFADSVGGGAVLRFDSTWGPSWSDAFLWHPRPTWRRHGADNGSVAVHVDGHAEYLRPSRRTIMRNNVRTGQPAVMAPVSWSPNPRITPYEPFARNPSYGGQRQR